MAVDVRLAHELAVAFASEHLTECAQDVLDWHETGSLRLGCKLHKLSALCQPLTLTGDAIRAAEAVVTKEALKIIAAGKRP